MAKKNKLIGANFGTGKTYITEPKIKLTVLEKIDKICSEYGLSECRSKKWLTKFKKDLLELCKEEYIDGSNACHRAIFRIP